MKLPNSTKNGYDAFILVGRLRERECSCEKELTRSVRPPPPRQKSATLFRGVADHVREQTQPATIHRCRQGVCPRGREGMPGNRRKLPVLAGRSQRHTRTPAANKRLRRSKRRS